MHGRQMEAMPRHDPVPPRRPAAPLPDREREAAAWARYKQTMKWMGLAAVVTVLLALIWLKSFGEPVPLHMTIATILGVGFTMLVGNVGAGSKLALLVTVGAAAYFAFLLAFARPIVEEVLGLFRPKREAAA